MSSTSALPAPPGISADEYLLSASVPIKADVQSQNVSIENIISSAESIWREVLATGVTKLPEDQAGNAKRDALLQELQRRETDFQSSFPIILRWMVQMGQYRRDAFHKYLLKYKKAMETGLADEKEYIVLQAEYLVLLFREQHPRTSPKDLDAYRKQVVKVLLKETDEFKKIQDEVAKELEALKRADDLKARQELFALLTAKKAATP
jgi:hypothetical protein